ncbi:MAG TPA: GtrA family protein [Bryobacteraceae bacterium]|nr:GtrA family protein [Bryobacteraceae bacterium]
MKLGLRWLKFNFVGAVGFAVQLAALKLLLLAGMNYLAATALAVEIAVLHNFVWHERFTWKDRPGGGRQRLQRLLRFHLGNGAFSILANLGLMWLLVARLHMTHLILANAIAVAICSVLNFAIGEWFVFRL